MAAPELRLEVSLGLNTFRSQMRQLVNIAQSEFTAQLNIRFNRRRLDDELNNLRRAIARRTYRIEIGGNLDAVPDKISTLKTRLKELEGTKINIPITGIASIKKKEARSLRAELKRQILAEGGKIKIPVVAEVQTKRGGAGGGFASSAQGPAGLFEYMRTQGMSGGNYPAATQVGRSERLRKALEDFTVKQLQALAKEQGIGGTSKLNKDPLIEKLVTELRQDVAEKILGDIKMQLNEGLRKNLDLVARGIFRMLGIDPQSLREKRLPPAINWQATAPTRSIPIGPSSTGRALPFGATPGVLPGSVFAQQKRLIGNRLDPELKEILRGAANTFVDSVRAELNAAVRSVSVRDLGNTMRAALSPQRIAGLLPAGVGRTPSVYASAGGEDRSQLFARRTAEAYARSALRGVDVMAEGRGGGPSRPYSYAYRSPRPQGAMIPYERGAIVPTSVAAPPVQRRISSNPFAGMGGAAAGAIGGFNLPGANAIRELGDEFKYATQQVLLFGTAYKGLAFLMGFPRQVAAAVSSLQSFRNSLKAISPTAEEAKASNQLILDLVDRYNIPLQSARDGFIKLYASMQPAGFNGEEIRGLFEGISKAAATYGMSADKVDRVTYAFAQMASKGQVMSEELKGQLGDVLPGAMAIFAEAAGFKGPDAISKFSKALEDGAYKGQAMTALLKNVTVVMNKEFGPGAEGAALTFQGVVNRLQNSMTLLYESFEPVAVGFLNQVVVPLTRGIKEVTDGLNSFFTGNAASTTGGGLLAQQLERLRPAFEGIGQNIQLILPVFQQFGQVAVQLGSALLTIAGNPVVGYLGKLYLVALPIAIALNAITTAVRGVVVAMTSLNTGLLVGSQRFTTYKILMDATGVSAARLSVTMRTLAPAINFVTVALRALALPVVLLGISALIERFMMLQGAIDGVRRSTQQMVGSISSMANAGAVKELRNLSKDYQKQEATFAGLRPFVSGGIFGPSKRLTTEAAKQMQELGLGGFVGKDIFGRSYVRDFVNASKVIEARLAGIRKEAAAVKEKLPLAERVSADLVRQTKPAATMQPISGAPGKPGKAPKTKKTPLNKLLDSESQRTLKLNASKLMLRLEERIASARLAGNEEEADSLNNLREALKLRSELAQLQDFQKMLIDKESEIVGKSLSQAAYNNKLQDTNVAVEAKANELRAAYLDIQVKENAKLKDREAKQKEFVRLLEDVRIENGLISEEQAKQINLARQYEDALSRFPFLTEAQKLALRDAIYSQEASLTPLGERIKELRKELEKLRSVQEMVKGSAEAIGDSFAQSFKDTISGAQTAQQALASFFQRIGDYFLDMAARMIQKWIEMQILGLAQSLLPSAGGLLTSGLSGGFSTGSAFSMAPGAVPAAGGITMPSFTGGISGGIQGFANGGMVTGPTLGLVGEGRYNEAIVPLPDGKSIPVDLGGTAGNQIVSNITVNVNNGQTQSNATGANSSELGRKLEGAVKQVIVGELRPGGLLSR